MRNYLLIGLGLVLLVIGFLTFWLPLPIGLPLIAVGVLLINKRSRRGRRWTVRIGRRLFPKLYDRIRRKMKQARQANMARES